MTTLRHSADAGSVSRRRFLRFAGAGLAALTFGPTLGAWPDFLSSTATAAAVPGHKRLVVLFLQGGNDGLNTVIPVNLQRYYDRRPTLSIADTTALSLNGTTRLKLHPLMTESQRLYNMGEMAILEKVGYPRANGSHFTSLDIWSWGVRDGFGALPVGRSGWIARLADNYASSATGVVAVGQRRRPRDLLGSTSALPLNLDRLSGFEFDTANNYRNNQPLREDYARQLINAGPHTAAAGDVFDASEQAYALSQRIQGAVDTYTPAVTYPDNRVGRRLRDVATLIQDGFDTSVFYTTDGGYDTHSGQENRHNQLLGGIDSALGAFAEDLRSMNAWDDTCVLVCSEFGRRNHENGSSGTDHGGASNVLVYGGGVMGGIYGSEIVNDDLDGRQLTYTTDFRTVFSQVADRHLGFDPAPLFPETIEVPDSPGIFI